MPVPTLTPTTPPAIALVRLADLLAASITFRAIVGAGSAIAALAYIHLVCARERSVTDDEDFEAPERPWAIINLSDESFASKVSRNSRPSGVLSIKFEFPINPAYLENDADLLIDFLNKIGAIEREMWELSNTPKTSNVNYLKITSIEDISKPALLGREDGLPATGDFYTWTRAYYWG